MSSKDLTATVALELKNNAVFRLNESMVFISKCLKHIDEEQCWQKPSKTANSIANLMLHLSGNVTQYIHSALGEQKDERERDQEFSLKGGLSKSQLYEKLDTTVQQACDIIQTCKEENLTPIRVVQGFKLSGVGIIMHVVEHFSYHTGQIAVQTKLFTEKDLGFYEGLNLTIRNNENE